MNKRIPVYALVSLLVASFVFASFSNIVRSADDLPDLPEQRWGCNNNGPWTGWYGEPIYFEGWASGGTEPYYFRWDWENDDEFDTPWSTDNTETHTYYPPTSPNPYIYQVKMNVKDSSDPPNYCNCTKSATVYREYDLNADVWVPINIYIEGMWVPIKSKVTNIADYVAPAFDWYARVEVREWPSFELEQYWYHYPTEDLEKYDHDDWTEWWLSRAGFYQAYLYIYADHDYNDDNDADYDGFIVWPD